MIMQIQIKTVSKKKKRKIRQNDLRRACLFTPLEAIGILFETHCQDLQITNYQIIKIHQFDTGGISIKNIQSFTFL